MRRTQYILIVVAVLGFPGPAHADPSQEQDLTYRVQLKGGTWRLRRQLRPLLYSLELQDHPPATPGLLRRRADEDAKRLQRMLRSLGYYNAHVTHSVDVARRPALLRFAVTPGPGYRTVDVRIVPVGGSPPPTRLPTPGEIGLPLGKQFEERLVAAAGERLVEWLRGIGHARPEVRARSIRVEHEDQSVHLVFEVDPGPVARFGSTSVHGLVRLRESYVRTLFGWQPGERFSSHRLQDLRQRLSESGLFSAIRLNSEASDDPAVVDVRLELAERPVRTLRAGAGYTTGPGPHLRLGWERRNLAGAAESLDFSAYISDELYSGEVRFRKPAFLRADQALLLGVGGMREDTEAYSSNSLRASGTLERRLNRRWTAAAGLALRRVEVEDVQRRSRFALVSMPLELAYDSSDDRLDPSRGMRLRLGTDPTIDTLSPDITYLRQRLEWRGYLPLTKGRRLGLATRLTTGTILGEEHGRIPADERFYAGGGGSIRGYDYKQVGPRRQGAGIGGRSLAEAALEVRWRLSERIGLVAFLDGGNAFLDPMPRFGSDWRWGAGGGVRLFTPIGPVRIDVASPLNPDVTDSRRIRFYVSIGQAF